MLHVLHPLHFLAVITGIRIQYERLSVREENLLVKLPISPTAIFDTSLAIRILSIGKLPRSSVTAIRVLIVPLYITSLEAIGTAASLPVDAILARHPREDGLPGTRFGAETGLHVVVGIVKLAPQVPVDVEGEFIGVVIVLAVLCAAAGREVCGTATGALGEGVRALGPVQWDTDARVCVWEKINKPQGIIFMT